MYYKDNYHRVARITRRKEYKTFVSRDKTTIYNVEIRGTDPDGKSRLILFCYFTDLDTCKDLLAAYKSGFCPYQPDLVTRKFFGKSY